MNSMSQKAGQEINVGVDVGKAKLDTCIYERDVTFVVENSPAGIRHALNRLVRYEVTRIVVEATGRYEYALVEAAMDKGLPIIVSQPLQIRRYAQAVGQLAKSDEIDARIIAEYAARLQPTVRSNKTRNIIKIRDLLAGRRQLMTLLTMEKNRHQIMPEFLKADIHRHIVHMEKQVQKIDKCLSERVQKEEQWRE